MPGVVKVPIAIELACIRGLVHPRAAFLRTPKRKGGEGTGTLWQALSSSKLETALAVLSLLAALVCRLRR